MTGALIAMLHEDLDVAAAVERLRARQAAGT